MKTYTVILKNDMKLVENNGTKILPKGHVLGRNMKAEEVIINHLRITTAHGYTFVMKNNYYDGRKNFNYRLYFLGKYETGCTVDADTKEELYPLMCDKILTLVCNNKFAENLFNVNYQVVWDNEREYNEQRELERKQRKSLSARRGYCKHVVSSGDKTCARATRSESIKRGRGRPKKGTQNNCDREIKDVTSISLDNNVINAMQETIGT